MSVEPKRFGICEICASKLSARWALIGPNLGQPCPKTAGILSVVPGRRRRRLRAGNQSHIVLIDFYQDRIKFLVEKTFFSMLGTGPGPKW